MSALPNQDSSKERILAIPILPPEIKQAVDRQELVVFIGAGVSRIIGCKSWSDLANYLIDACFDEGCINFKEKQRLLSENNLKKRISICQHILEKKNQDLFMKYTKDSLFVDKQKSNVFPIYEKLHKLRAIYITTNVDTCFDDLYFKERIKYDPEDFDSQNINRETLYHLHGSLLDEESMVLTVRGYLKLYNNKKIKTFLAKLFTEYSVLFVGYGLEEFEILDFLLEKSIENMDMLKDQRHFILLPMFRGEENILSFE
jgi:hypothetical protein